MTALGSGGQEFLLALADDKHLMGQQHAEWIGVAPFLEEDLAFCSIGQDELGHAALLYELVAASTAAAARGDGLDERSEADTDRLIDRLAFERGPDDYRSAWLVEAETPEWNEAVVRHWLFDHADRLRWEQLAGSAHEGLADIAQRVEREEAYHRRHADALIDSLMSDDDAARSLTGAATRLAPLAAGLFEPVAGEADAVAAGVASGPFHDRIDEWKAEVEHRFGAIDWSTAPDQSARTERSPSFGPLMSRMREVLELDPSAEW